MCTWYSDSLPFRHLGLAGTCGDAAGLDASGLGRDIVLNGASNDVRVRERGLGHLAERLAGAGGLLVLLVGGEVEGDEENEVRADDTHTSKGSELLASALAGIGHPGVVGRGEVGVGGEVDEAWDNVRFCADTRDKMCWTTYRDQ